MTNSETIVFQQTPRIGFFDSGVGGLTILEACLEAGIEGEFLYLADTRNMPYGEKSLTEILHISQQCIQWLVQQEVDYIIVACNTAAATLLVQENTDQSGVSMLDPVTAVCHFMNQQEDNSACSYGLLATPSTINAGIHLTPLHF